MNPYLLALSSRRYRIRCQEIFLPRLLRQLAPELAAILELLAAKAGGDGRVNVGVVAKSFPLYSGQDLNYKLFLYQKSFEAYEV